MPKKILIVGCELASDDVEEEEFCSKVSLLDWDIILFRADISEFYSSDTYQGKPDLNEAASFQLKECSEHWRREIKQAMAAGKTVIVFLGPKQEVYVDTGKREYSGTGRNQKTTKIVQSHSNYDCLPVSVSVVNATGNAMKLTPLGTRVLAPFWTVFGDAAGYKVLLTIGSDGETCVCTRNGDKPVGAIFRSNNSSGTLMLLPDIDFSPDEFFDEEDEETVWTGEAQKFADQLISAVVALDKNLHASSETTPEPAWATATAYSLAIEQNLRSKLLDAERQVEEAQMRKENIQEQLKAAGRLRALLYEKGKALEGAIIQALKILGFDAHPFAEVDSEFDVVFECHEGRLIGEAEGKDTKAINIDKLRQLAMNIHEDLQRDDVTSPAKPVLFGNGYRLTMPDDREVQFTAKCISASEMSNTALVTTSDLYRAAQYLTDHQDEDYARICREALLGGLGLVQLPAPPVSAALLDGDRMDSAQTG
jgi:hypothetical protein